MKAMFLAATTLILVALVAPDVPDLAASRSISPDLPAESLRTVLLEGLETHRQMDIEYTRAIPDSALRWAPVEGVRDFAEQIAHTAVDNIFFVVRGVDAGLEGPDLGSEEMYLGSKASLERAVVQSYDWVMQTLRDLSAEEMFEPTVLFGDETVKWRVYMRMLNHADFTRGQMVPYFRMHGMAPPGWRMF